MAGYAAQTVSIQEDEVRPNGRLLVVERSLLGEDRPIRLVEAHFRPEQDVIGELVRRGESPLR